MPTIIESLQSATAALNNAVQSVLGLKSQLLALYDQNVGAATTIINNFENRAPVVGYVVDPVNGLDTNDGKTIATAKRTLDAVLDVAGNNAISVLLFGDVTLQRRHELYYPVTLVGAQLSAGPGGYIVYRRQVSFLGTALNSPNPFLGSLPAQLSLGGGGITCKAVDFLLPDVPLGQDNRAHIVVSTGVPLSFGIVNIRVASAGAGWLIQSVDAQASVSVSPVFATSAAGHLFFGVAAGSDPNALWAYSSNCTSA